VLSLLSFLFFCTVTDFSAAERDRGVKFCMRVGLLSGQVFSPFGELWLAGVTGAALLHEVCGHLTCMPPMHLIAPAHEASSTYHLPAPTARVSGHSELGAVALRKPVWRDLHLASLLMHLFIIFCCGSLQ